MPATLVHLLTEQQKNELIQERGLDPNVFEIAPDGSFLPRSQPLIPTAQSSPLLQEGVPLPTNLESLGRGAAESFLPTLGGIGTGALGGSMFGLPGMIIGGIAGGLGTGLIQDKIVPESIQQSLFLRPEDIQENPVASAIGGFAPSALAFNPLKGVADLPKFAGGIKNLFTRGATLSPAQKIALGNVGFGAGIESGIMGAEALLGDRELGATEILTRLGLSAILNEPTPLGKKLGIPSSEGIAEENEVAAMVREILQRRTGPRPHDPSEDVRLFDENVRPSGEDAFINRQPENVLPRELNEEMIVQRVLERLTPITPGAPVRADAITGQKRVGKDIPITEEAITPETPYIEPEVLPTKTVEPDLEEVDATLGERFEISPRPDAITGQKRVALKKDDSNFAQREQQREQERLRVIEERKQVFGRELEDAQAEDLKIAESQGDVAVTKLKTGKLPKPPTAKEVDKLRDWPTTSREEQQKADAVPVGEERSAEKSGYYKDTTDLITSFGDSSLVKKWRGKGNSTVRDVFRDIINTPEMTESDRALIKHLWTKMKPDELNTLVNFNENKGYHSYAAYQDFISLDTSGKYRLTPKDIIHEVVHATTTQKIERALAIIGKDLANQKGEAYLAGIDKAITHSKLDEDVRDILKLYSKATESFRATEYFRKNANDAEMFRDGKNAPYGASNISEFVAEAMSNRRFQEYLQSLPPTQPQFKNFYEEFISKIKDILGVTDLKMRTMLDEVLNTTSKIISRERSEFGGMTMRQSAGGTLHSAGGEEITPKSNDVDKDATPTVTPKDTKTVSEEDTQYAQPSDSEALRTTSRSIEERVEKSNMEEVKKEVTEARRDKFLAHMGSAIDKVAHMKDGGPVAQYVADKLYKHANLRSLLEGVYRNRAQEIMLDIPSENLKRIDQHAMEMYLYRESKVKLNDDEKKILAKMKTYLVGVADANEARKINQDPHYWPAILSPESALEWTQRPTSEKSKRMDNAWMEHAMKKSEIDETDEKGMASLKKVLEDYKRALGGEHTSVEFGALRKAAGIGLPEELQVQSMVQRFSRYGERVAKDMAYFKYIQQDPVMLRALDVADASGKRVPSNEEVKLPSGEDVANISGTDPVKNVMKFVNSDFKEVHQPRLRSSQRLVSSSLLGLGTAIRNLIQIPLNTIPNVRLRDIGAYFQVLPKIREAYRDSFKYNARQIRQDDQEFGASLTADAMADTFNKAANFLSKIQGREYSEQFERAYEFGLGKIVALQEAGRALKGDKYARKWLEKFGDTLDLEKEIYSKQSMGDVSDDSLSKLAKAFVDRAAGTYDERGLPAGTMEGALAPFFALSRWSIEKANVIYKDVVQPAMKGDTGPLLKYTLGAYFTGEVIQEISALLSNSEPYTPTVQEAFSETTDADAMQKARAVINVMQLGSYGGIISDMMKMAADITTGHKPQGGPIGFPLVDFVGETLAKGTADYVSALKAGEDKFDATLAFATWTIIRSVQTARLLANKTSLPGLQELASKDVQERKKMFRNIRIFRELEGETLPSNIEEANPFVDRDVKEFKRTPDASRAVELAPEVVSKTIEKFKDNPARMIRELRSLRQIPTSTFPNPENNPQEFVDYIAFLTDTKGEAEAQEMLQQFLSQRQLNKAKTSLLPKL